MTNFLQSMTYLQSATTYLYGCTTNLVHSSIKVAWNDLVQTEDVFMSHQKRRYVSESPEYFPRVIGAYYYELSL